MSGNTVLVLRALGLGDLCTGVPAIRAIRRHFPRHRLVLAAPAWQEPLACRAGVDAIADSGELRPLDAGLHGADVAVNLHGRGPESTRLLAATRPRRLVAFDHPELDRADVHVRPEVAVTWRSGEHEVHRWCRLLEESGIPANPDDLRLDPPVVGDIASGTVVIHPGAAAPARRWPPDRFAAVAAALIDAGRPVVLTGSSTERPTCERIADAAGRSGAGRPRVLAGRTDLSQLAGTVADAALVVCNDTGVAHLASAFATPSVVLFGPTSPDEWGPPRSGPHRALWAGRRGDPHGRRLDPGLAAIGVDEVLDAIEEVVARVPA